jgi:hypothetical protein
MNFIHKWGSSVTLKFLSGIMLAALLVLVSPMAFALKTSIPPPTEACDPHRCDTYPAIGKSVVVNFGDTAWRLVFDRDGHTMTFTGIAGEGLGYTETVQYEVFKLRHQLYMVSWQEPLAGSYVVHIHDFANGFLHSNIIDPGSPLLHLTGSLTIERRAP